MKNFEGKKVAILGLGIENIPLVKYLLKKKADLTVCDQDKSVKGKVKGVSWRLGQDYLKNLEDFKILFRTPGMPRFLPELLEAEKKGVLISSQTKLFFDLCPARIIGVTGTKGKGTTCTLIYKILKESKKRVFLGGNIGKPPISFLDKLKKNDWVVLELSSFQLQDLEKSPQIACVLNITQDHLDLHKTPSEYLKAKENIVRYQGLKDIAIINADYFTSYKFAALSKGEVYWFSRRKSVDQGCFIRWQTIKGEKEKTFGRYGEIILRINKKDYLICPTYEIDLIGLFNLENICAAILVSYLAGAKINAIKKIVTTFRGLEHRLEFVREIKGVEYYNDSFATTPEATEAALESFSRPVILILGGSEKKADYRHLGQVIAQRPSQCSVKTLILIGETAQRIEKAVKRFKANKINIVKGLKNMKEIVERAYKEGEKGEIVLLSPASASLDMFSDYKDRGEQFKKEVKAVRRK